jgi:hypothetical protein
MMTFNLPSLNTGDTPEPTAPVEPTTAGSAEPPVEPEEAAEPLVEPGAAEPRVRIRTWLPPGSGRG